MAVSASSLSLSPASTAPRLTSAPPSNSNGVAALRFPRSLESLPSGPLHHVKLGHCFSVAFGHSRPSAVRKPSPMVVSTMQPKEPLRIMISGAPASGKGTQCELIKQKYGLVHIAAGDLLRGEIAAGTDNGKRAKEYMEKGMLVPDEIIVMMVKERLLQPDAQEKGWLLDGYPRSLSQAKSLEDLNIRPDLFILLDVSEESLIDRVVGRRLDPVTGKIYHLTYSPPESEEIAGRLTQRFDDTEEKVKLRLQTHNQNVEAVLSVYADIIFKVDGNASKEDVFAAIDGALTSIAEKKSDMNSTSLATGVAH